jgi:hypothetical protein
VALSALALARLLLALLLALFLGHVSNPRLGLMDRPLGPPIRLAWPTGDLSKKSAAVVAEFTEICTPARDTAARRADCEANR